MAYATSRPIDASRIPVIDVGALGTGREAAAAEVARALTAAARDPGFFYVRNHGVAHEVLDDALAASKRFFSEPAQRKSEVAISERHRGWLRVGEARMYGGARPDLKESFVFGIDLPPEHPQLDGRNPILGSNRWPAFAPALRPAANAFFEAMSACATRLMRAFALALDLAPDTFTRDVQVPVSRGSFIYYPPQPPDLGEEQFGVAPHSDYGCLTLLWQDATGGLEVRDVNGEWVTAHPIEDTLVVNVGDLLARWSNDRFRSTPHRVINRSGGERYSMALFYDPDADTVIDPRVALRAQEESRYPPITCAEHILARYGAAFAYRR